MEFLKKSVLSVLALLAAVGCGRVEAKITKLTTLKNQASQETICFVEDDGTAIRENEPTQQKHLTTITEFCKNDEAAILCANAFLPYKGTRQDIKLNQNNAIANIQTKLLVNSMYPINMQEKISQLGYVQALDTRHEIIFTKEARDYDQAGLNQALVDLCLATKQLFTTCEKQIKTFTDDSTKTFLQTMLEEIKKQTNCAIALGCPEQKKIQKSKVLQALKVQNAGIKDVQEKYATFQQGLIKETETLVTIQLFLELDAARKQNKKNILMYGGQVQLETIKEQLATMGFVEEHERARAQDIIPFITTEGQAGGHVKNDPIDPIVKDADQSIPTKPSQQKDNSYMEDKSKALVLYQERAATNVTYTPPQISTAVPEAKTTTQTATVAANPQPEKQITDTTIAANQQPPLYNSPSIFSKLWRPTLIAGTVIAAAIGIYKFGPTLWHWMKRSWF